MDAEQEIDAPSEEFVKLSSENENTIGIPPLEFLKLLENYPNLSSDELIFCIALRVVDGVSPTVSRRLLNCIQANNSLVANYSKQLIRVYEEFGSLHGPLTYELNLGKSDENGTNN